MNLTAIIITGIICITLAYIITVSSKSDGKQKGKEGGKNE